MITKEFLLNAPKKEPYEDVHGATSVYFIPNGEPYEGNPNYQLITCIASDNYEFINCGDFIDAINLESDDFVIDCFRESGIMRVHRHGGRIGISPGYGGILDLTKDSTEEHDASKKG